MLTSFTAFYHHYSPGLQKWYEAPEAHAILRRLAEEVTQAPWHQLSSDYLFSPAERVRLEAAVQELLQGRPLQYILGRAWFWERPFHVGPAVLIPRRETEELVAWVIAYGQAHDGERALRILDIGTGSGCIAVTLALELAGKAELWAVDSSRAALRFAEKNAQALGARVGFSELDV